MTQKKSIQLQTLTTQNMQQRTQILHLCYKRLKEMITECESEATLLKCIEVLEKRNETTPLPANGQQLNYIQDTIERINKAAVSQQNMPTQ